MNPGLLIDYEVHGFLLGKSLLEQGKTGTSVQMMKGFW